MLKPFCSVSRIAYGLPMGSELEYADEVTLSRALKADGRWIEWIDRLFVLRNFLKKGCSRRQRQDFVMICLPVTSLRGALLVAGTPSRKPLPPESGG